MRTLCHHILNLPLMAMFLGFAALAYAPYVQAQTGIVTSRTSSQAELQALMRKIDDLNASLAVINNTYLGASSPFIPLESYMRSVKSCANSEYIFNGSGCNTNGPVIKDAQVLFVRNKGTYVGCPGGWTQKSRGNLDGGFGWAGGSGGNYTFCIR